MKKELLQGLTEEQIAKVKACKTQEEMLSVAKNGGVELTDEQLEAVSGGSLSASKCHDCKDRIFNDLWCPRCGFIELCEGYCEM